MKENFGLEKKGSGSDSDTKLGSFFYEKGNKNDLKDMEISMIGLYGDWAASLMKEIPIFSFRGKKWNKNDIHVWKEATKNRLKDRLNIPKIDGITDLHLDKRYIYDGLQVEEISWQLPYGRRTQAIVLKPQNQSGRLPGILALHDHGGIKYFGKEKITRVSNVQHEMMRQHQLTDYGGVPWANAIAKRGYVVLVHDAFPFASRRVMLKDVPVSIRKGLTDSVSDGSKDIASYNQWAADHESTMARSLFSAGLTWPGVFTAEDKVALDILCNRGDVIPDKIGCGGLSGGGMRTVFLGGLDERIKCTVCVGFMTTWRDFLLNKSFTHTWMTFVPLLPNELDFPEILGLRVPLPTLVLNNQDDGLYTLSEMKIADKILRDIYEKAGETSKYQCSFYPGRHKFDIPMQTEAFSWFDQWLKK